MFCRTNKHLLVTGGAGFIGSAFIRILLQENFPLEKIVNLDLLTYAGSLENVVIVENDPRYSFVKGDILDADLVTKLVKTHDIDTIVHFAAESHVDRSIVDPQAFYKTNVEGTISLLEVVRCFPHIHFHHISTDEVFGSIEEGSFTEVSPYQPRSPYSASKASADHFVRSYANTYDLSVTLSHSSNNFGPFQHREKFIPHMIELCVKKEPLTLYGDGRQVRDWLFVEDHARAIWAILQKGRGTYNIGARTEILNRDLLRLIIQRFAHFTNADIESLLSLITHVPDRPGHDFRYSLATEKIEKELGWTPRIGFEEALEKTLHWYLENVYAHPVRHPCPA